MPDGSSPFVWKAWRATDPKGAGNAVGSVSGAASKTEQRWMSFRGTATDWGASHFAAALEGERPEAGAWSMPHRLAARIELLVQRGQVDEAAMEARRGIASDPSSAPVHLLFAWVLHKQERIVEAVWAASRAEELAPDAADPPIALSTLLNEIERSDEARVHAERAIALHPDVALGYLNLTSILLRIGNPEGAIRVLEEAKSNGVRDDRLLLHECLARLDAGDLPEGWDLYEYRFLSVDRKPEGVPIPRWEGEELGGRSLLVWSEQGLGDEVRFLTCIPDVLELGGRVIIETQPRLETLVRRSFPSAEVRLRSERQARAELHFAGIDLHAPAGDLPRFLRRSPESFARGGGVFLPDPARQDEFERRLAALGPGPKIGVSWRSGNLATSRLGNYLTVEELGSLLNAEGRHLVNLQYGEADFLERELQQFEQRTGTTVHRWSDVDYMNDLEAVAALTASLDVVVGPASFPTDLSGVLGVPTIRLTAATPPYSITRLWSPSVAVVSRGIGNGWSSCRSEVDHILESVLGAGE